MAPKKKGKGNKLAKMSDEERARYLQHLADIEEEARRRKEELIARYMKNKLNKEEMFARINLAKINQNWRQILRKVRVKDMAIEIQAMIATFTWAMDSKTAVISRLMTSLEEAEDQYSRMLQTHMETISHFLEISGDRLKFFHDNYEQQKDALIEQSENELHLIEQSRKESEYSLQLVIHQQQKTMEQYRNETELKNSHSKNATRIKLEEEMNSMLIPKQLQLEKIWNNMRTVFSDFVNYHKPKIQQYESLRQKDSLFRKEISQHMDQFIVLTEMTSHYQHQLENLKDEFQFTAKNLKMKRDEMNLMYTKTKINIVQLQEKDKNQLEILSGASHKSINSLSEILSILQKIVQMDLNCKKFETESEKVVPWNKLELSKYKIDTNLTEDMIADIEALDFMENLWFKMNRVTVHSATLKAEGDSLKQENRHLKNCLKNLLMETALGDIKGSMADSSGRPASMRMYRIIPHPSGTCDNIIRRPVTCIEGSTCNAVQYQRRLNMWKQKSEEAKKIVVRRHCW